MDWPKEMVLQLIDLYRDRPALWNCRIPQYNKDRDKRVELLAEIADEIGVDKDEVERKLRNLTSHYSRESKKEKYGITSNGSRKIYKSKWFCYSNFDFLKTRKSSTEMFTASLLVEPEQSYSEDAERSSDEAASRTYIDTSDLAPNSPEAKRVRIEHQQEIQQRQQITEVDPLSDVIQVPTSDEYDMFGAFVATEMRQLRTEENRRKLKRKIMKAIVEVGEDDESKLDTE